MTDFKSFQMGGEVHYFSDEGNNNGEKGLLVFTGVGTHTKGMVSGIAGGPLDRRGQQQSTEMVPLDKVDPVEFRVKEAGLHLSFDVPPYSEIEYPYWECDLSAKAKCDGCHVQCCLLSLSSEESKYRQLCEKGCAGDVGCQASNDS
jgi:hypothetical protein